MLNTRMCDINAIIQVSKLENSRKQAAMQAITALLSSDCQPCFSSFWKNLADGKEPSSLNMTSPKIHTWIHSTYSITYYESMLTRSRSFPRTRKVSD